jgi:ACT domain-containing protein
MSRNQQADKKLLLKQLEKTPIVEAACKHIGLPRSTYYRWRKEDDNFAELCDETIELSVGRVNDLAESQLINAIKNQNMTAITFWLKHHHHSYRNRLEVDAKIQAVQQELTPEQSKLINRALRLAGVAQEEEENVK